MFLPTDFLVPNSSRCFDKDKDGFLSVTELEKMMTSMGSRMTRKEFAVMAKEADSDGDGLINYKGNQTDHYN